MLKTSTCLLTSSFMLLSLCAYAQPRLETGSQKPMPAEWIDKDTGHKLVRLSRLDGDNESFYFHNNPFVKQVAGEGDKMVFYNTTPNGKRLSVEGEIAGHEFFSRDGKTIWFDLQKPRSTTFYLAGANVATGAEKLYEMTRDEWSIHFNISPDQTLFAGDGGDPGQVAKATDGMWIYLFRPAGNRFKSERLVNMKHHGYKLEPNVHFSPDGKWVIFRANFEGQSQVHAVEIAKTNS